KMMKALGYYRKSLHPAVRKRGRTPPTGSGESTVKQGIDIQSHEWIHYERVIVFDGVCNFCNAFVNFVLDRDTRGKFKFGTLQSPPGRHLLMQLHLPTCDYETFVLLEKGAAFTKST